MPQQREANCLFCDDIRNEVGNKISIIGVYAGDIIFAATPPVPLLKLGVVLWIISDVGDLPDKFTVAVIGPNKAELLKLDLTSAGLGTQNVEGSAKAVLRAVFFLPPTMMSEEGPIEVTVDTGREVTTAGRLMVRFTPPASTGDSKNNEVAPAGAANQ